MKSKLFQLLFLFFSLFLYTEKNSLFGGENSLLNLKPSYATIYKNLDPTSIAQLFAFHELYPETPEGKQALTRAWKLLHCENLENTPPALLPSIDIQFISSIINNQKETQPELTEEQLSLIENLAKNLSNRRVKGSKVWTEKEILELPYEEIDLARALFISEIGFDETNIKKIRHYEAALDLMALQILAKLPEDASDIEKIHAINDFIFYEKHFRFPPHSVYAKDIDMYTFLPAVMDSRRGVCLGVSILYLCLAQRLELELESITPPGHIYLRYHANKNHIINIETTARGVNMPSEVYLGIETKSLQTRNIKEVVGLAFMNIASVYWMNGEYKRAIVHYKKALLYIPDDYLALEFMGYNYLFIGKVAKGKRLLEKIKDHIPSHAISKNSIIEDFLSKKADIKGIKAIYKRVDEKRESILTKRKVLEKVIKKYPKFRAGLLQLANTWLQLGRTKEALGILEKYQKIDKNEPIVNYYLSAIYYERYDYNSSWKYLSKAQSLLQAMNHNPKALKDLYQELNQTCPNPYKKNMP